MAQTLKSCSLSSKFKPHLKIHNNTHCNFCTSKTIVETFSRASNCVLADLEKLNVHYQTDATHTTKLLKTWTNWSNWCQHTATNPPPPLPPPPKHTHNSVAVLLVLAVIFPLNHLHFKLNLKASEFFCQTHRYKSVHADTEWQMGHGANLKHLQLDNKYIFFPRQQR